MDIIEKSPAELEKEFYSKKFYLSYSGLSKLMYSPNLFYRHYILQQREEKIEAYLIDGKVIHCLLLDDGSFDKQFILSPSIVPSGNTKLVVDKVYAHHVSIQEYPVISPQNLEGYKSIILDILKEINLHQSLKTDQQRIDKILTEETKAYFEFLKTKGKKDIIDNETLTRCTEAVEALKADQTACSLLGILRHELENIDIFNEIPLKSELNDIYKFGIHGVIDNIKIDYDTKKVYVNDLKTTSKSITEFQDSVDYYNYWIQAAIYERLVKDGFKELLTEEWEIIFHFVVIDKYNQVYCFKVTPSTLYIWQDKLELKLKEFEWHYTEKVYKLPYAFAKGEIIL